MEKRISQLGGPKIEAQVREDIIEGPVFDSTKADGQVQRGDNVHHQQHAGGHGGELNGEVEKISQGIQAVSSKGHDGKQGGELGALDENTGGGVHVSVGANCGDHGGVVVNTRDEIQIGHLETC